MEKAKVYFTKDISSNGLIKIYEKLGIKLKDKVAVKISTGEPGGQILICVDGEGWYQEEGKEAQSLKPGDVVTIPANVKHWHGAKKNS